MQTWTSFILLKTLNILPRKLESKMVSCCRDVNCSVRAWLHGKFQPGLKFRSTHRAEILLWLHAQFQPGRKTQISVRKFTEVWKHNQCACSCSFFGPGWNSVSITWDFFRFLGPFGRAENPIPVWEYRDGIFSPDWTAPWAESHSM